jgi:hypothetical protein
MSSQATHRPGRREENHVVPEAGAAEVFDLEAARLERGRRFLAAGRHEIGEIEFLLLRREPRPSVEQRARSALATLRRAMDWLEDSPDFEEAHRVLDLAGEYVRRTFGCKLHWDGSAYYQRCPVALAHVRVGMSIAYVARERHCSICGQDPDGCPHIRGRVYGGQVCVSVVTRADLIEVSLVSRPAHPDARIESMSVPSGTLRAELGSAFKPGVRITCDRCLGRCTGVTEIPARVEER